MPTVLSGVKESLACLTIGTVVSTGLYAITILQADVYFRKNGEHSTTSHMRSFVAFLFVLDTISMVLTVCGLYEYVVTDHPSLEDGVSVLIGTLTQLVFAQRLWALSKRNVALVSGIAILALCSFGAWINIVVTKEHSIEACTLIQVSGYQCLCISTRLVISIPSGLTGIATGTSVVCDVAIVAALCYYLRSRKTGFKRTDSMISRLIMYAVNRGVLTAVCQAGEMITTVALPGRFVFIPFALLTRRLYCNTLFATINAQKSPRGDGNNVVEFGTQILHHMNVSTPGNGSHRSTAGRLERASDSMPTFVVDISSGKTMKDVARKSSVDQDA
ncbi:hypothetical protein LXA43DRAFT_1130257 [Ganoderma leucocontextum]|nr:hypothetical protein LXA43DRAFT_1130257 [Ganoderma leucocontextum]